MLKNLIVIAGPTAVGKTALSVKLAKHFGCPIVSADSRQFYKEMSIGTAKPTEEEMDGVPHYLINNISINQPYNVGEYEKEAIQLLDELFKSHSFVILTGGSGLYIQAILNGVDEFEQIPKEIRTYLTEQYQQKGIVFLQEELKKRDEIYYHQVDLKNPQRLMRALEVCIHQQKPYSSLRTQQKKIRSFNTISLLVNMERELLYEKINQRVDMMMTGGLLDEVKKLYPYKNNNALNTVGYKELFAYIEGESTLEDAIALIKQNTRNYAKRQLTWFKNQSDFEMVHPEEIEKIKAFIEIVSQYP